MGQALHGLVSAGIACQIGAMSGPRDFFDDSDDYWRRDERTIKLNPQGVSGVEQGVASVYFAVCHGDTGPDSDLATKYAYDVK